MIAGGYGRSLALPAVPLPIPDHHRDHRIPSPNMLSFGGATERSQASQSSSDLHLIFLSTTTENPIESKIFSSFTLLFNGIIKE